MSDPVLPKLELPSWMNQGEVARIAAAAYNWFSSLSAWALWPLRQLDPMTCGEQVLDLIAWQRDITRFADEPLELYRLRVKYAYANARDAGSVAGFKKIFTRLQIGYVEFDERVAGQDWDIITMRLTSSQVAENGQLLQTIIQQYGRTCRRYGFSVLTPIVEELQLVEFNNEQTTVRAVLEE